MSEFLTVARMAMLYSFFLECGTQVLIFLLLSSMRRPGTQYLVFADILNEFDQKQIQNQSDDEASRLIYRDSIPCPHASCKKVACMV